MNPAPSRHPFSALRHANFRLFFFGQGVSLIGTWMQTTVLMWLVWELKGKTTHLGYVSFVSQIPNLIFTPLAGVLADRYSRKKLVIWTQVFAMIQAFALAGLTESGIIQYWHIIGLSFFLGVVNAFDMPTRQSFIVQMVGKPDLPNAIALNSFVFNIARILGPSIAAFLIVRISKGEIFFLNAISYFFVLAALYGIRPLEQVIEKREGGFADHLGEAIRFTFSHRALRDALLLVGVLSFMGFPFQIMMPAFAEKVFGGGEKEYMLMMSVIGAGALLGGIIVLVFHLGHHPEIIMPLACMLFGFGIIGLTLMTDFHAALGVLLVTGGAIMMQTLCTNTFLQNLVPDRFRGRVMSFYTLMLLGLVPIGSLLAGFLSEWFGLLTAARFGGTCCVLGGIIFWFQLAKIRISAEALKEIH